MTDCNKIQANNIACNEISLTEQYKHGNLPDDRLYYYRFKGEPEVQITTQYGLYCEEADNKKEIEVIDFVPSYEEWKAAQEQLHKEGIWYTEISHKKVLKENAELKELLKECKDYLPEFETPMDILAKIDEALK
jgi:hypothetical protein